MDRTCRIRFSRPCVPRRTRRLVVVIIIDTRGTVTCRETTTRTRTNSIACIAVTLGAWACGRASVRIENPTGSLIPSTSPSLPFRLPRTSTNPPHPQPANQDPPFPLGASPTPLEPHHHLPSAKSTSSPSPRPSPARWRMCGASRASEARISSVGSAVSARGGSGGSGVVMRGDGSGVAVGS